MPKQTQIFVLLLTIVVVLMGINYYTTPILDRIDQVKNKTTEVKPRPEPGLSPEQDLLNRLSNKQKLAQLIAYPVEIEQLESTATPSSDKQQNLAELEPGIITLFGQKISTESAELAVQKIRDLFENKPTQPFLAVDHEGGSVQRLSGPGFTKLPHYQQACNQDQTQNEKVYKQSAQELAQIGINFVFAPVVDVVRFNSALGLRGCQDPDLVVETAATFIKSFGHYQIMPVIKHYPGIGQLSTDLHHQIATVNLEPKDTTVFSRILNQFPNIGVMTTHVRLKDRFNNKACSQSAECLSPFKNNYPETLLFTDALDMESAQINPIQSGLESSATVSAKAESDSLSQRAILSLEAGNEILVFGKGVTAQELNQVLSDLVTKYQSSAEFKDQVDQVLIKVVSLKIPQQR